jgi:hypothetical protein
MNAQESMTALTTLLSITGVWILVFWLYRDYRVDHLRQKLFTLRNELFDWAADGGIEFDNPAYGFLRTTLNGFLRFGDRLSFGSLFSAYLVYRDARPMVAQYEVELKSALEALTPEQRERVNSIIMRMHVQVTLHVVIGSSILLITLIPAAVLLVLQHTGKLMFAKVLPRPWVRGLDFLAFRYGDSPQYV